MIGRETMQSLYLLRCGELHKIGIAVNVPQRVKELQTGSPHPIEVVADYRLPDARQHESFWHRRFGPCRVSGEWFALTPDDIAIFQREAIKASDSAAWQEVDRLSRRVQALEKSCDEFRQCFTAQIEKDYELAALEREHAELTCESIGLIWAWITTHQEHHALGFQPPAVPGKMAGG